MDGLEKFEEEKKDLLYCVYWRGERCDYWNKRRGNGDKVYKGKVFSWTLALEQRL